jgi:hypothetical protein
LGNLCTLFQKAKVNKIHRKGFCSYCCPAAGLGVGLCFYSLLIISIIIIIIIITNTIDLRFVNPIMFKMVGNQPSLTPKSKIKPLSLRQLVLASIFICSICSIMLYQGRTTFCHWLILPSPSLNGAVAEVAAFDAVNARLLGPDEHICG